MPEKTRYPDRDLTVFDYITWLGGVIKWLDTQVGEADYPAPLADALQPLLDALHEIYNDYITLKQLSGTRGKVYTSLSDDVLDQLRLLKDALPTIISDPNVLAEFALAEPLPRDRDEIYHIAEVCVEHWGDVSGDPEFALMVGDFNTLVALFGDFVTAREHYYTTFNAAQQKQNEMLDARAACHEAERKVFTWYNARHRESEDEWWTGTWWGTTSGGEEPGETKWDAKPTGKIGIAPAPLTGLLAGCMKYLGTDRFDIRIASAKKNEDPPDMPLVDYVTDVEQPVLLDADGFPLEKGFVYYVWIRARKGGEVSEWSDVVGIEWEG